MSAFPRFRTPNTLIALGSAMVLLGSLTACAADWSTPLTKRQRDVHSTDMNVKFKDCGTDCTGEIDGAKYTIKLPRTWNGTLLLYSHGYRFAEPSPPNFDKVETYAQVTSTDDDGNGDDPLSEKLLAAGYALAGSSYKSNGWAVGDGVTAGKELYDKFVSTVAKPKRTYVWGDSLGGLVTEVLAEKNTDWVDGSAPMCGAVAGPQLNFNLAADVATAVKELIDPGFKVADYASSKEAADNWKHASAALVKAASDVKGGGTAKVLYVAGLVDAPTKTRTYDGASIESQVKARVEMLLTALAFGTSGRYELEQQVGGNVSDTANTDYSARISDSEASLIKTVGGDVASLNAKMADAPRITADPAAVEKAEALGDTTGEIQVPTITMHTEADPLVIVQNEVILGQRARAKHREGDLVQLYISPPASYTEQAKAPYGAGHCNFTDDQRIGLITALDNWARRSTIPVPIGIQKVIGEGFNPAFVPGPWPAPQG